jgi:hypothetical protein
MTPSCWKSPGNGRQVAALNSQPVSLCKQSLSLSGPSNVQNLTFEKSGPMKTFAWLSRVLLPNPAASGDLKRESTWCPREEEPWY